MVSTAKLLLRMLSTALRRHVADGAFQDLEQRPLNAFHGHIAGNRRLSLLRAILSISSIHDAALRPPDVMVGIV